MLLESVKINGEEAIMVEDKKYIIALDQGTTSSRAIIFDKNMNIVSTAQKELTQIYPKPGWVEHNPLEIWSSQRSVLTEVIARSGISLKNVAAIGITNQNLYTMQLSGSAEEQRKYVKNLKVKGLKNI